MIPYINIINHSNEQIFVYHKFDNSLFQIGIIHPHECILKTIPIGSTLIAKKAIQVNDIIIPNETLSKKIISNDNYIIF